MAIIAARPAARERFLDFIVSTQVVLDSSRKAQGFGEV